MASTMDLCSRRIVGWSMSLVTALVDRCRRPAHGDRSTTSGRGRDPSLRSRRAIRLRRVPHRARRPRFRGQRMTTRATATTTRPRASSTLKTELVSHERYTTRDGPAPVSSTTSGVLQSPPDPLDAGLSVTRGLRARPCKRRLTATDCSGGAAAPARRHRYILWGAPLRQLPSIRVRTRSYLTPLTATSFARHPPSPPNPVSHATGAGSRSPAPPEASAREVCRLLRDGAGRRVAYRERCQATPTRELRRHPRRSGCRQLAKVKCRLMARLAQAGLLAGNADDLPPSM